MRLLLAAMLMTAALPLAACDRQAADDDAPGAKAAVETPTRKAGLWKQTMTIEGLNVVQTASLCLDDETEKQVELMRYIEVLEECLGRKAKMEMLPLQPGDVPDTMADVSDLEADVGYSPRVTVEEGVRAFVDWYRDYMKA